MKYNQIILFLLCCLLASCGGKKKTPAFYDTSDIIAELEEPSDTTMAVYDSVEATTSYDDLSSAGGTADVPFVEKNGVKYVDVAVNGLHFEMIFDTGCSSTSISVAEAEYLYNKGYLTNDDFLGMTQAQIADGSIVEDMVVNLKEVVIGGRVKCTNVTAVVSSNNNAPLLLGNEVLDRVASYAIDNQNKTINFKLK